MAALGRDSLIGVESRAGRAVLRFRRDNETRRRLDELVAAESVCCSFLDLVVTERPGRLELAIGAPEGREREVIAAIVAAFSASVAP